MDTSAKPGSDFPPLSGAEIAIVSLIYVVFVVFALYMNWRIAAKAGYSGAFSLLLLIPIVNVVVFIMFAFSKWPIERRLEQLQSETPSMVSAPGGPTMPAQR